MVISAEEFRKRWDEPTIRLNEDFLEGVPLSEQDRIFLLNVGFPEEAAPFLSFDDFKVELKPIHEKWGSPYDYSDEEKSRLRPYMVIGSDGAGNPIAIDTGNNCEIVHLDHDDWFNTVTFVNSSISNFALFLLLTKEMMEKANSELSEEELEDEIPESYKNEVLNSMQQIDPKAMEEGKFWRAEVGML